MIGAKLINHEFHWEDYLPEEKITQHETVGAWVDKFEAAYFDKRKRTPKTQTTWDGDYHIVFRTLCSDNPVTLGLLLEAVKRTEPDSKTRQRTCMALAALARLAGIDPSAIVELRGNYGTASTLPRELPTDEEVIQARENLTHAPPWLLWSYGMIAAYGLRPSELFHLDLEDFSKGSDKIRVTGDTKTGHRLVIPLHREWVELFQLRQIIRPESIAKTNKTRGEKLSQSFKSWGVPFPPYHLRHAWAVRAIHVGLDSSVAARMMGHSLTVHNRSYQKWLSESDIERAYERTQPLCQTSTDTSQKQELKHD